MGIAYAQTTESFFNTNFSGGKLLKNFYTNLETSQGYQTSWTWEQRTKIWSLPLDSGYSETEYIKFRVLLYIMVDAGTSGGTQSHDQLVWLAYRDSTHKVGSDSAVEISNTASNTIAISCNYGASATKVYYYHDYILPISSWSGATGLCFYDHAMGFQDFTETPTSGIPTQYTLTITKTANVSELSVSRISGTGATGTLSNNSYIYKGDYLSVSATPIDGYSMNSDYQQYITVSGNTTVAPTAASATTFTLRIIKNAHVKSVSVKRISTESSAGTGVLSNGATLYLNDELTVSVQAEDGYRVDYFTKYLDGITVLKDVSVAPTAKIKSAYRPFVWNGTQWRCIG